MSLRKTLTYGIFIGLCGIFVLFVIPSVTEDNKQSIRFVEEAPGDESVIGDPAGVGIINPVDVGLKYPSDVIVSDPTEGVGYMLLGVDMETMDYIPLRMDVDGYIMCKDVNKAIFKLVPKDNVGDESPEELIELIRKEKEE